ncbi:MAG: aminotransferase class V-fold PLP-dependent enzyme [Candidatus Diapherotrites archaeon]|nr:aminotransferase class V-fold PLP-dependent enzyme [Candidatus Diapherotrites archaeon]
MDRVYFDHAATTPVREEVLEAMQPYFSEKYGNASSLHSFGQEAREALETSRATVAKLIGANPEEVIFTGSGTESNNTILKGTAFHKKKGHIITSAIEHPCVLNVCKWLETRGFDVTYLPVNNEGIVSPGDFANAFRNDTIIASVMTANNEIGSIQPIEELQKIASEKGVPFHTDAVQGFGKIPLARTDALTVSAHKLYGPKGVGVLCTKGIDFDPLLHGGGHETGRRSGTENVAGAVGFARAAELAFAEMGKEAKRQTALRDQLIDGLLAIDRTHLNGPREKRLPNNVNVWFEFIEGEALVLMLDGEGIAASTGSACSQKELKASHALLALGLEAHQAHGSLRMTIGRPTTEKEVDYALEKIPPVVQRLRKMSPFKKEYAGFGGEK